MLSRIGLSKTVFDVCLSVCLLWNCLTQNYISFSQSLFPLQNSGPCNSFHCLGHFKNVYNDEFPHLRFSILTTARGYQCNTWPLSLASLSALASCWTSCFLWASMENVASLISMLAVWIVLFRVAQNYTTHTPHRIIIPHLFHTYIPGLATTTTTTTV